MKRSLGGLSLKKLRLLLALFFLALALPTGILIAQAYSQLKWEAFHQHQVMAEELADRARSRLSELIAGEEARGFADYAFLVVAGDPATNYVQRSPLASFPIAGKLPGLVGYFQVDTAGAFSTPLVPAPGTDAADFGIGSNELQQRQQLAQQIRSILTSNRLVRVTEGETAAGRLAELSSASPPTPRRDEGVLSFDSSAPASLPAISQPPEEQIAGQAAFDQLNRAPLSSRETRQRATQSLGRVEDLQLEQRFEAERDETTSRQQSLQKAEQDTARRARKEVSALPEPRAPAALAPAESVAAKRAPLADLRVRTFESEIDPFEFSLLESGHFVLFRKVWRDGERYIQGLLIEQQPFLIGLLESAFRATALSQMSNLIVAYQGDVLSAFSGQTDRGYTDRTDELRGALLYQARLAAPMSDLQLIFSVNHLPAGPGGTLISWIAIVLAVVLCGGFLLMYRLGREQITLARQQQDFVSAVSHELKTPLTSIRLYGEMLREGWAPDEKKREYYDYIHDESERLSRLINNVLQLARMTRNDLQVNLKPISVRALMDTLRSKIASQVERAGFELNLACDADAESSTLDVDTDYFVQIFINLIDNAIKFSSKAEHRAIDIGCQKQSDGTVAFTVRDYGPGIPGDQMKKIFRLFYRSESELTRETIGTGIGLALVNQLAAAMNGTVDVLNREPGAEFRLSFRRSR